MTLRRLTSTAVLALGLAAAPSFTEGQEATLPQLSPELETVREGLSKYKDFNKAESEFYAALGCIYYGDIDGGTPTKFEGGGGEMTEVSYPMLQDGKIDAMKPEGLIYEQSPNGDFTLAAVVYMLPATPDTPRPSLFGRPFDGPIHAEKATPLQHVNITVYELHAWLWKENPNGVHTRMNPKLPCNFDSYEVRAQPAPFSAPPVK
jgi:hypothetical protein